MPSELQWQLKQREEKDLTCFSRELYIVKHLPGRLIAGSGSNVFFKYSVSVCKLASLSSILAKPKHRAILSKMQQKKSILSERYK